MRALILCYDFPPCTSAGAARAWSWFLHMAKFGVEPVVVTRHWDDNVRQQADALRPSACRETTTVASREGRVVRTPFSPNLRDRILLRHGERRLRTLRRFLSFVHQALQFCTFAGDARRPIHDAAERLLETEDFDVILATGEPFVLFRYASRLSARHGVPWVADYRDLWQLNHIRGRRSVLDRALLAWEGHFEKRCLHNAAFAVTVSDELARALSAYLGKTVHVLENGAELTLYEDAPARSARFRLVYTGILYDQPYVETFAAGFRRFMASHPDAEIDVLFVGVADRANRAVEAVLALQREFPDLVQVIDRVSFREAAHHQARASVLLSFIAGSQARGLYGAKTYAYAATRNPILVVPAQGGRETSFFPGRDIQRFALDATEVEEALTDYYERFRRGESLRTSITDDEVRSISREHQVGRLVGLIEKEVAVREPAAACSR